MPVTNDTTDDVPSRDEIEAETNTFLLEEWLDDVDDIVASVRLQHAAFEEMGVLDPKWAHRAAGKLYYAQMAASRIRRRLRKLGRADD